MYDLLDFCNVVLKWKTNPVRDLLIGVHAEIMQDVVCPLIEYSTFEQSVNDMGGFGLW